MSEHELTPADLTTRANCQCGPYRRDELLKCQHCETLFCCDCAREMWDSKLTPWLGEECVHQVVCPAHIALAYSRELRSLRDTIDAKQRMVETLQHASRERLDALRRIAETPVAIDPLTKQESYAYAFGYAQGIAKHAMLLAGEETK